MIETPAGGNQEAFGMLDALIGVSPFVFVVGLLTGLLAAGCVYPIARWADGGFTSASRFGKPQLLVPMALGGVGLLSSAWIAMAINDVWRVDAVWWALIRNLFVVGTLAAPVQVMQHRDAGSSRRQASRLVYVVFVVFWTGIATLGTVLLLGA